MMSRRWWKRAICHHLPLAVITLSVVFVLTVSLPHRAKFIRFSLATAYMSLVLLTVTLVLGPLWQLRNRPVPVSSDLRRDVGLWAALVAALHVWAGLKVHLRGQHRIWRYFFARHPGWPYWRPRGGVWGFANHLGLVASLLLALLLLLSSDRALRALGSRRWKALQRANVWLFASVIAHAVLYQLVERREVWVMVTNLALGSSVVGLRFVAALRRRRGPSATGPVAGRSTG